MISAVLQKLVAGNSLDEDEARLVMTEVMDGRVTDAQIAGLITALHMKKETEEEIAGFARAIRAGAAAAPVTTRGLVDTCGTGGDGLGTFNVSTAAAFVVAALGVPVAKHGNRSVSSRCGSADVLEALGAGIDLDPSAAASAIDRVGVGFLFAPRFHAAMKHAVRARSEIKIRTIFNLLGPLTNPVGAEYHLMGVYEPGLTGIIGRVFARLGVKRALVVSGAGGLDELSTLGDSTVAEVDNGVVSTYSVTPEMFGLTRGSMEDLKGGDKSKNARIMMRILEGEGGPRQDIVALNAAAALFAARKVESIAEGIKLTRRAIRSGDALRKLQEYVHYTQTLAGKEGRGVGHPSTRDVAEANC